MATADILADFGRFLRLHTADGDASPATIRSYYGNAAQNDIAIYGCELVAQYEVGTVAVKLAAIRRLYEAAVWRGLRQDNSAAKPDRRGAGEACNGKEGTFSSVVALNTCSVSCFSCLRMVAP